MINEEVIKQFEANPNVARQILGSSLEQFIRFFHWYMYRNEFIFKPFHTQIIQKLEDIAFGRAQKKNLLINIPPRFGKSAIIKYFCAWSYLINPQSNTIYTSYSEDLVKNFSKEIREIIESPAFQTFTGIKLNKAKTGADYWATEQGGGFRAAPLGGSLTGFGGGISSDKFGSGIIIDDPLKASDVKSQAELQNCIDYYLNTLKSRANNQAKTPFICIMQRLAIEDLAGYIMENESTDWDILKIPALNEDTGEALWEEKFSAKDLLKLKNLSPFVFYGQYQQEPIVVGGSVYKTEWFKFYNPNEHYDYQFSFITADTAQKKGEGNDFTVLQFWAKTFDNRLHLIDMIRGKYDAVELKQQVKLFWQKCNSGGYGGLHPYGFYIEDKSSGIGVIQEIKKTDPIPVIPIQRNRHKDESGQWVAMDKFSRAMTAIPYIANGWVYLPNGEKDPISSQILNESAAFKADLSHKHDDACFEAGSMVSTLFGKKPIEKVKVGEYVFTPLGICRVKKAGCTGYKQTIEKFGLKATKNHKIFTENGFLQLDALDDSKKISIISLGGIIKWKYKNLLHLMEFNTNLWGRDGITCLSQHITLKGSILKDFMLRFGSFILERKFQKAMLFITKTITILITTSLTWSVYQGMNILNCIKQIGISGLKVKNVQSIWQKLGACLKLGTKQKNQKSLNDKTQKDILLQSEKKKSVCCATENLQLVQKQKYAKGVETQSITEKSDEESVRPVFNLQIEKNGVYYVNNILVSNCDAMNDAIDIAFGATGISSIFI